MLKAEIYNRKFNLMAIYGPNQDSPNFYEHVFDLIPNNNPQHYIMFGDYNIAQNQQWTQSTMQT